MTPRHIGLVLTLGLAACAPPPEPVDFEGVCPVLVDCAEKLDSLALDEIAASVGIPAECWETGHNYWPQCRTSCVAGLEAINEAALSTGQICGGCKVDADCTAFGRDGDPSYCLEGWCARLHYDGAEGGGLDTDTGETPTPDLPPSDSGGDDVNVCSTATIAADCLESGNPRVRMTTNFGDMVFELDRVASARASEVFLAHVSIGHYDNTIVHRVAEGLLIQGGVYTPGPQLAFSTGSCSLASTPDLTHVDGAIALIVEDGQIGTQWYITDGAQPSLDGGAGSGAVFGHIVEGLAVRDAIAAVPVLTLPWMGDYSLPQYPTEEILISALSCE